MSNVEQILQSAAQETRQLAQTRRPPKLKDGRAVRPQGWLVFAAAFAVVAVTFGVIPLLTDNSQTPPVGESTPPTVAPDTTPTTVPLSTPSTVGTVDAQCSADGAALPAAVEGLPDVVAATRQAIIEAAADCDFATLEGIGGDELFTSFGAVSGVEILRTWEDEGRGELGTLLQLLGMSYDTTDDGEGGVIYAWPSAAGTAWDDLDAGQIAELSAIHSEGELDSFATAGAYLGWRTGIAEDGTWLYFVAGD